jgi:predicted nuclease with TOPRIM domain
VSDTSLHTEIARLQGLLAAETARADRAEGALDTLQGRVDSGEFSMVDLTQDATELRTEIDTLMGDLERLTARHDEATERIDALTSERDAALRRADTYRAERDIARQAAVAGGVGQVVSDAFAAHRDANRAGREAAHYRVLYHQLVPEGQRRDYSERSRS